MILFDELNDDNFILYAAKHYFNPTAIDTDDFFTDLNRFKYINRQLIKYYGTGRMSERLFLNHLIIVFNVFGIDPALKMLEYKVDKRYWSTVKTALIYLKYITNDQYVGIRLDHNLVAKLREI